MHKAGAFFFIWAGLLGPALLLPRPATAAWPTDPHLNVPLCVVTGDQFYPVSVSDGVGGAIVAWEDHRSDSTDIYVRRIAADGTLQWSSDGVALCTATNYQSELNMTSDGAGGAIVVWVDDRSTRYNFDVYAQRISADGVVQWTADGVALCTATDMQIFPTIVSDGAGGAIIVWNDWRSGNLDIYAQRVSADGTVQWPVEGVALFTAARDQITLATVSDGVGGAIVACEDFRNLNYDIYAQRISADGTAQWTSDGVALCTVTGSQHYPTIASDGGGGAIVTWEDERSGGNAIYAQRVSADGTPQWTTNGVALCSAIGPQYAPTIVAGGAGGAIVTWFDGRSDYADIYAQKISADGAVQWTANGVALCTADDAQYSPIIVSDGTDGAIVTWYDYRSTDCDVYAQRVSADGTPQWTTDGVALCTAESGQMYPTIVSDGAGGAIAAWQDHRYVKSSDIFAQRVNRYGQLGDLVSVPSEVALTFALGPVGPNPMRGGALTVQFTLANPAVASLELLDIAGRRIAGHEVGSLGAGRHALDLGDSRRLAPGLYLVRLTQGASVRVTRVVVLK